MSIVVALLAALAWPAAIVYAVWRLAPVLETFAPERAYNEASATEIADSRIPPDLAGLARQYPDAWAQEDIMQVIRERYAEYKDWNKVRSAMGVAHVST